MATSREDARPLQRCGWRADGRLRYPGTYTTSWDATRGRVPSPDELPCYDALVGRLGSLGRGLRILRGATGDDAWQGIREVRAQDLLVYIALSRFDRRPSFGGLPRPMQLDVRAFFGSYATAIKRADEALFSLGDPARLDEACRSAAFGKLMPEALYVHLDAVDRLPTALRLYEGCARTYLGRIEGATVVKLGRREPKASYLSYPDFDVDPHPTLTASTKVDLRTFRVKTCSYAGSANPPLLHRKEELVPFDYPGRDKFARLTKAEAAKGLFDEPATIGTRDGWSLALAERRLTLRGHRLVSTSS